MMESLIKSSTRLNALSTFLKSKIPVLVIPNREQFNPPKPRKVIPPWLPKQKRAYYDEELTRQNADFVKEVITSKYGTKDPVTGFTSPLKVEPIEPLTEWKSDSRRTGVIARKIGIYPMWMKNGDRVNTTLLQVCDNHVIKYIPPDKWEPKYITRHIVVKRKLGCLVVGADSADPQKFTKEYCGLFTESGVMPKKILGRFTVSPDGALQPGTPLYAAHFKPGQWVDIRAKTIDRGFQGVMKRWGFHGMPATHGVTKTHRRPGNIGSGGCKARVMPGTKLPGHMGNRYRTFRGIQILRVNNKYNVIWVRGQAIPGETNSYVQIHDSLLPHKKHQEAPYFPTYIPGDEPPPEELYLDELHQFSLPSIEIEPDKKSLVKNK